MNVETLTHVTLNLSEVAALVKEKLGLEGDVKVTVLSDPEPSKLSALGEWIAVPPTWSRDYCPELITGMIEVMFRNGETTTYNGTLQSSFWEQENHHRDIVKYRRLP